MKSEPRVGDTTPHIYSPISGKEYVRYYVERLGRVCFMRHGRAGASFYEQRETDIPRSPDGTRSIKRRRSKVFRVLCMQTPFVCVMIKSIN